MAMDAVDAWATWTWIMGTLSDGRPKTPPPRRRADAFAEQPGGLALDNSEPPRAAVSARRQLFRGGVDGDPKAARKPLARLDGNDVRDKRAAPVLPLPAPPEQHEASEAEPTTPPPTPPLRPCAVDPRTPEPVDHAPLVRSSHSPLPSPIPVVEVQRRHGIFGGLDEDQRAMVLRRLLRIAHPTPADREALRCFSVHGGFLSNEHRATAYPMLLGLPAPLPHIDCADFVRRHRDWEQVRLDVARSMTRFGAGRARHVLCGQLEQLLHACMARNPRLYYYQGYGDVCSVLLLMFGEERALAIVEAISTRFLLDMLRRSFDKVQEKLRLLYALLGQVDGDIVAFLCESQVEPTFAVGWLLTWFSRAYDSFEAVARLFDFFLGTDPVYMPLYYAAALVLARHGDMFALQADCADVFCFLTTVPQDRPIEQTIRRAWGLYQRYPVKMLRATLT